MGGRRRPFGRDVALPAHLGLLSLAVIIVRDERCERGYVLFALEGRDFYSECVLVHV